MYFYVEKKSLLHSAHPLTKTFALLGMFLAALLVSHPLLACIPLAAALVGITISGAGRNAARISPILFLLIALSAYIWTFIYLKDSGDVLMSVGPYFIPRNSFLFGLGMGIRIGAMMLAGLAFLAATRVEDFTNGLHKLGLPYGLCFGLSLSFRLLPSFLQVVNTVREAQKSRGLDLDKGGIISKTRKHVPLLVPVFVSSIRHSDDMALALLSRGFGRSNPRTYLRNYNFGAGDISIIFVTLSLIVFLAWISRLGIVGI